MSKSIVASVADFTKQIADSVAIGDTTFTLNSLTDADGVALADAKLYGFTIDTGAKKEYVVATLSSGTFTGVKSISRQGAVTTGFTKEHRIGVAAQITDHAALYRVVATLLGVNDLDSGVALKYDGAPAQTAPNALATVQFVLDTANGGAVSFNATTIAGVVGENVTDGDWVYFKESDGKWYKTDADDTAKSVNVKIGKVRATTTTGNSVAGGIFVDGQETVATYVAGTTYYLSNTAGALATSAGTNSVVVGVGDEDGDLVFFKQGLLASTTVAGVVEEATQAEVDAGTAAGATGARLFINPSTPRTGTVPVRRTYVAAASPATWTKPSGLKYIEVEVQAPGGGGGGPANGSAASPTVAGGGGSGSYGKKIIAAASLGSTETVTIGAAGTGAANGPATGGTGGTVSFGTHVSCTGGAGGGSNTGGAGGTASSADINVNGGSGNLGFVSGTSAYGGSGANSILGPGGTNTALGNSAGQTPGGYGGGGSGGCDADNSAQYGGAAGAPGIVIVTEYYI